MAQGPGLSLRIDGLALGPGTPLFSGLRLDIAPGEVVALLGPSGVGKTTLLRILSGAEARWQGEVLVGGLTPAKAPVPGYVFQDARLLPWLTAAENLRAVAPDLPHARIDQLLAQVGLAGLAGAWPHALSGGMQRRLALARALAVNPGLLLLDEPFVSLDRALVRDLQALFRAVFAADDPTVVIVTHDPEDAAAMADRAIILSGRPARIVADVALSGRPGQRSADETHRLVRAWEGAGEPAGVAP